MSVYQLTVKTLSPLHIGDGGELRQDFDFVTRDNRMYRIDEDALLKAKMDAQGSLPRDHTGRYLTPGALLRNDPLTDTSLFRYVLGGMPRSAKVDARVRSFIKDVYDRPYIPGSSLKGALRTALAWNGWKEVRPSLNDIGRNRSWAGQKLERSMFGANPNLDLLRALQVSDLFGPEKAGGRLLLVNAQVLTKKSAGSPVELEAIPGDVEFKGSMTIDETLFSKMAEPVLHFSNRRHWLEELMPRAQAHSLRRIEKLAEWFEKAEGTHVIARFYRQLAEAGLQQNQALMQIGWGAGWDGKTFWTHLQEDPQRFERIVQDFRLSKAGRSSPPRTPGEPFPRSRRAVMVVKNGIPQAAAPFGWVLVEITPNK